MPLKGLVQISLVPEEARVFFRHLHFERRRSTYASRWLSTSWFSQKIGKFHDDTIYKNDTDKDAESDFIIRWSSLGLR